MNNLFSKEMFFELLKNKKFKAIKEIFDTYPNIDIADACNQVDRKDEDDIKCLLYIFKIIKPEYSAAFFSELDTDLQELVIKSLDDALITEIIEESSNDELADFIVEWPANVVDKVLKNTSPERRIVLNKLLGFKEDSAGSVMTTEFITLLEDLTVKEALATIRKAGRDAETIYTLFVKNKKYDLIGVLELDDLIFAEPDSLLKEVAHTNFQTVNTSTDQEEVAQIFKRYELNAIGVLNQDEKLVGIITFDDVLDIIEKETSEDIESMAKVSPLEDSYTKTKIWRLAYKCIPWLIILIVLNIGSIALQNQFQDLIGTLTVISVFLTLICDTGGNSGSQSSTLIIRGLATGDFKTKDVFKIVGKEVGVASITGGIVSVFSFAWILIMFSTGLVDIPETASIADNITTWTILSTVVAISIFITILLSKVIGALLPFVIKKIKLDPAVIAGPVITTIMDLTTLGIYFGMMQVALTFLQSIV